MEYMFSLRLPSDNKYKEKISFGENKMQLTWHPELHPLPVRIDDPPGKEDQADHQVDAHQPHRVPHVDPHLNQQGILHLGPQPNWPSNEPTYQFPVSRCVGVSDWRGSQVGCPPITAATNYLAAHLTPTTVDQHRPAQPETISRGVRTFREARFTFSVEFSVECASQKGSQLTWAETIWKSVMRVCKAGWQEQQRGRLSSGRWTGRQTQTTAQTGHLTLPPLLMIISIKVMMQTLQRWRRWSPRSLFFFYFLQMEMLNADGGCLGNRLTISFTISKNSFIPIWIFVAFTLQLAISF